MGWKIYNSFIHVVQYWTTCLVGAGVALNAAAGPGGVAEQVGRPMGRGKALLEGRRNSNDRLETIQEKAYKHTNNHKYIQTYIH